MSPQYQPDYAKQYKTQWPPPLYDVIASRIRSNDPDTTIDEIIKKSDIALYEAKNLGRSQVLRFEDKQISPMEFF